ncbi:serine kinase/phosphatase [Pseudomonas alliivorans]|uniref:serine kinase/phosphatase n=1 Tax=Pseudomonas alliivorans TaxID=2810613 RepID=UPI001AE6B4D5|nr:serine kinase/phosphatase [Pseudomonas alliivorans]MBP0952494.1 serine kinase/phosphatase [Pseudomonas alliivorans]MEE4886259.1 serine kinase/phosphatase [Pseudomonas alliivorans]MEE4922134.1 serine kinase/phosphatase [Pseudomonas alliivorans]MEE4960172.1 serine kinase/phosphatase [Pseudomonas alliivorans]MEE4969652.1 serine kinase/phosphatase [Pseudomonas alliivorans]
MNDSRRPFDATQPEPIDDNEDRMGSMEELNFRDDETARIGDLMPEDELQHEIPDERVREAGMTGASTDDHQPTDDDLSPETLIHEDGARSASERGEDNPADLDLTVVDEDDIGGGDGMDEEEMAIVDPLDGKAGR